MFSVEPQLAKCVFPPDDGPDPGQLVNRYRYVYYLYRKRAHRPEMGRDTMSAACVNTLVLVLVTLVGCAKNNSSPVSKNTTIEEAARIAISEVMSRDKVGGEKLHADAQLSGNGWFVMVTEDSYRQAAFWHMRISSTGEVSEFCGGE
jgi:hypothetical protein